MQTEERTFPLLLLNDSLTAPNTPIPSITHTLTLPPSPCLTMHGTQGWTCGAVVTYLRLKANRLWSGAERIIAIKIHNFNGYNIAKVGCFLWLHMPLTYFPNQ